MVSVFSRRSLRAVFSVTVLGAFLSSLAGLAQSPEFKDAYDQYTKLQATGRYAEAEALYRRTLDIRESALGPEHLHLASSLNAYAKLLRATGRIAEAIGLESRAKNIWAKHSIIDPRN